MDHLPTYPSIDRLPRSSQPLHGLPDPQRPHRIQHTQFSARMQSDTATLEPTRNQTPVQKYTSRPVSTAFPQSPAIACPQQQLEVQARIKPTNIERHAHPARVRMQRRRKGKWKQPEKQPKSTLYDFPRYARTKNSQVARHLYSCQPPAMNLRDAPFLTSRWYMHAVRSISALLSLFTTSRTEQPKLPNRPEQKEQQTQAVAIYRTCSSKPDSRHAEESPPIACIDEELHLCRESSFS